MIEWIPAPPAVLKMGQELIRQHHEPLLDAHIGILFRSEAPKTNGKRTLGKASKVGEQWKPLLKQELDFVIWLAQDVWNDELTHAQRRALLDHELCHCYMSKDGPKMRPHDVEEFACIIERHGLWHPDLERVAWAMQQHLFGFDELAHSGSVVSVEFSPALREAVSELEEASLP